MAKVIIKDIKYKSTKNNILYNFLKRLLDILVSLIVLMIFFPIIIFIYILIKIESRGPFIYTQTRVGINGKEFEIYKLRTMFIDAEKNGIKLAQKNDSRITKVGKILRRTKIDEIPQLINVLKNEMSIVGPRPERPYFVHKYTKIIPNFKKRLIVKPGLTGYAQINGEYDTKPDEKLNMDLHYIQNRSIVLDLMISLKTFIIIIKGNGFK